MSLVSKLITAFCALCLIWLFTRLSSVPGQVKLVHSSQSNAMIKTMSDRLHAMERSINAGGTPTSIKIEVVRLQQALKRFADAGTVPPQRNNIAAFRATVAPVAHVAPAARHVCKECKHAPIHYAPCHDDAYSANIQRKYLAPAAQQRRDGVVPVCDEVGLCTCNNRDTRFVFDGKKCVTREEEGWHTTYQTLREKWVEVPSAKEEYVGDGIVGHDHAGRQNTVQISKLADNELLAWWSKRKPNDVFTSYYASILPGKKVLDIGSGLARQTMQFAQQGAHVTFVDIVADNLKIIERIAGILHVKNVRFVLLTDPALLGMQLGERQFDFVTAFGSCHHTPHEIMYIELQHYFKALKIGARWLQLAYPVNRWLDQGQNTFRVFGQETDGAKTPWAEWYEPGKLLKVFSLAGGKFTQNWCGIVNAWEFIWFELVYHGPTESGVLPINNKNEHVHVEPTVRKARK